MCKSINIFIISLLFTSCCTLPFFRCRVEYNYKARDNSYMHHFVLNDSLIIIMQAELFELKYLPEESSVRSSVMTIFNLYNYTGSDINFSTEKISAKLIFPDKTIPLANIQPAFDTIISPGSQIRNKNFFLIFNLSKEDNFFKQDQLNIMLDNIIPGSDTSGITPARLKLVKEKIN